MKIKNIQVSNFRSFDDCQVELGDFNVIIGANASGKSNFVQIFRFIRDIIRDGLENAFSLQGGIEYFRNINLKDNHEFSLNFTLEPSFPVFFIELEKKLIIQKIQINQLAYQVFFKILHDHQELTQTIQDELCLKIETIQESFLELEKLSSFLTFHEIKIKNSNLYPKIETDINNLQKEDKSKSFLKSEISKLELIRLSALAGIKENLLVSMIIEPSFTQNKFTEFIQKRLNNIHIYDFEPKLSKKIFTVNSKLDLEEDGSNLVILLRKVLADSQQRQSLLNLVSYVIPSINKMDIEKFSDKFLIFSLEEKYKEKIYQIPSSLLSDGTINIIAIILALYFNKPNTDSLIIIEEPEKNIHPHAMSKIVEMMKEVSKEKQIIITTHSPEIVKYAGIKNLLLMIRNQNGFSKITRPADSQEVQSFLKNEIGVEDLYIQNLLDIGV